VSQHLHYKLQDYASAMFYCPHARANGNQHIQIRQKTLQFFSTLNSVKYTTDANYYRR